MKREQSPVGLDKDKADVSTYSCDQQKKLDDRFDRMETMIVERDVTIQKIQASLSENKATMMRNYLNLSESAQRIEMLVAGKKDPFGIKKHLKQGSLRATFNIDDVPDVSDDPLISEKTHCAGANWWGDVRKEEKKDGTYLAAYLNCEAELVNISYDTCFTIRLLGSSENIVQKFEICYTSESQCYGYPSFILWSKLVNFTNGFLDEKGNFKIEIEFSVNGNKTTCVLLDPQFLTCGFVESDCTLLVEDRRFPVNRGLLAAYSNYFKTLLFGEFREKNQDEIELIEVDAEECLYLLKAIYPPFSDADVNQNNVESLLRLADCYQVKAVSDRCSQYLKKCAISEVPLQDKLLYAQNYRLSELLEHCIKEYKKFDDVKKLRKTSQYSLLDKDIKLRIHERIYEGTN